MRVPVLMRRCRVFATLLALATTVSGCGAADGELDPTDLTVRDLLGVEPKLAVRWTARQRAGARRVLESALAAPVDAAAFAAPAGGEPTLGALVHDALVRADVERERHGAAPVLVSRIEHEAPDVWVQPVRAAMPLQRASQAAPPGALQLSGWDDDVAPLPARGAALLLELAVAAGRDDDSSPLLVQPAPRAPFAVAYVASADLLLVNPVLLAALEPDAREHAFSAATAPRPQRGATSLAAEPDVDAMAAAAVAAKGSLGNPYAFFGSLGECGEAQKQRCEACLPSSTCKPVTRDATDGNAECTMLAADSGRGYYLLCVNVALAIRTVSTCVEGRASACPQLFDAGNQLSQLTANAAFFDDATCVAALDACLGDIYGAPPGPYPIGSDAGPGPPPPAPRNVDVSCSDCNADATCNFDPQCDPQCDSSCQGGSCGDCSRGSGTGSGSSSGGGCGSCDSGGSSSSSSSGCDSGCGSGSGSSSSSGSSCSGCDSSSSSSSSSGSSCSSCDSSSSSSSSGSSCSGCNSSSSSSSSGSSCSSGSGGSSCSTVGRFPLARQAVNLVSVGWAFLPLVVLVLWRRRELRRAARARSVGGDA